MREKDLKTILIVDDDQGILSSLQDILEDEGFQVLTANNGQKALELLQGLRDVELPDLILLDYMMPVWNAEKFNSSRMKEERFSHIPVVLMTANSNLKEIMGQVWVEAYINKPMNIDTVLKIAHNFIVRRKLAQASFLT